MQISIFGIAIAAVYSLLVVGLLVLLWYPLRRWRLTWVPFALAGLVAIAAPWAEEYWIASRFEELCKEAGVHVYRTVEVEGFLDATSPSSPFGVTSGPWDSPQAIKDFDRTGYRFQELLLTDGRARRLERTPDGIWQSLLDRPTARYHYKHAYQPTPFETEKVLGWKLKKTEVQVVNSQTGEVIAREVGFNRYPSVLEGMWIRLFGSGLTQCPDPGKAPPPGTRIEHLPAAALKPSNPR